MDDRTYKFLRNVAISLTLLWIGWWAYDSLLKDAPGDKAYLAGNNLFKDAYYERALASYQDALAEAPDHLPAMRGAANSLIQLGRYDEALATINEAIAYDPQFPGHYATRGILNDRMGRYEEAIQDYETALALDPELADGMHWLQRLLYNVQENPPTIADRLRYLREQMALPEDQRLLRLPDVDSAQRPYEQ